MSIELAKTYYRQISNCKPTIWNSLPPLIIIIFFTPVLSSQGEKKLCYAKKNVIIIIIIIYFLFLPQYSVPREWKNYAMQRKIKLEWPLLLVLRNKAIM